MADYIRNDNLVVQRGDDRGFSWPLLDSDGDPIDLSQYSASAEVRPFYRSGAVLHAWSTDAGNATFQDGAVVLSVADSENWDWTCGWYTLQVTDGDGESQVIARGSIVVGSGGSE